jgi:hypothetical protein
MSEGWMVSSRGLSPLCTLFYACSWEQVTALLVGVAIFVVFAILFVGLVWCGIEYERSKRAGIDVGHIDKIIKDARRRAYERGRMEE